MGPTRIIFPAALLLAVTLVGCFPGEQPAPSTGQEARSVILSPRSEVGPPPDRDLFRLAAELRLGVEPESIARTVNRAGGDLQPGHRATLWLVDFEEEEIYQSEFELRLVSPRAYWYVEEGQSVVQRDLERSAEAFEEDIYPRVTAAFGREWDPGIDGDPHIYIIHANLPGVGGYYGSGDEHPEPVYPRSNQREIIYLNSQALQVGRASYLRVLAHELQHLVHWNQDPSEETWVNEGLSELAVTVADTPPVSGRPARRAPGVSLVHWPLDDQNVGAHYGAASLFFHYLAEHYGGEDHLLELVTNPADGVAGVEAYLVAQGVAGGFRRVFGDWVAANFLDQRPGPHGYAGLTVRASTNHKVEGFDQFDAVIPQYAAHYIELTSLEGPVNIRFSGPRVTRLLPTDIGEKDCWWSNAGDSITSILTAQVDLRGRTEAGLSYEIWHEIEEDWDYGYLQVSTDDGATWQAIETPNTSAANPLGNNFGYGYTGNQDWTKERIDLSQYAGRVIQVRFQYVTDDAVNGSGLCLRDLAVAGDFSLTDNPGWEADGFALTDNRVNQEFIVQVIEVGAEPRVSEVPLDGQNAGTFTVKAPETLEKLMVVVAALAPHTRQPAGYTIAAEPGS